VAVFTIETLVQENRTLHKFIPVAHSSLTVSDKGPPPQDETEIYTEKLPQQSWLVLEILRYFFPFARNSRHVFQIFREGT
jgi:hypothetical protein